MSLGDRNFPATKKLRVRRRTFPFQIRTWRHLSRALACSQSSWRPQRLVSKPVRKRCRTWRREWWRACWQKELATSRWVRENREHFRKRWRREIRTDCSARKLVALRNIYIGTSDCANSTIIYKTKKEKRKLVPESNWIPKRRDGTQATFLTGSSKTRIISKTTSPKQKKIPSVKKAAIKHAAVTTHPRLPSSWFAFRSFLSSDFIWIESVVD